MSKVEVETYRLLTGRIGCMMGEPAYTRVDLLKLVKCTSFSIRSTQLYNLAHLFFFRLVAVAVNLTCQNLVYVIDIGSQNRAVMCFVNNISVT